MITQEELHSRYHYNPETGVVTRKKQTSSRALAGSHVGTLRSDGYLKVSIDGVGYLLHRLIWFYVHGRWPTNLIDHINLDRKDNRLSNLREANRSENYCNSGCRSHSTTGLKGVSPNGKRWMAKISFNHVVTYLGTYDTPEEAHQAYVAASSKHHGEFGRVA